MASLWYFCGCRKWVEASRCAGNSAPAEVRVFVEEADLPATIKRFRFLSTSDSINCWTIDPAGTKVCLPDGEDIYTYRGPFGYDACADCEDPGDPSGDGDGGIGGGGGGPGGGGGGGGGGGDGAWPGGPGTTPEGIKATVCSAHLQRAIDRGLPVDHLYVPASEPLDEGYVFTVGGGVCVSVPTGPVVEDPDPAYWVGAYAQYETCSDCTDGYKAELCPDDAGLPGAEDAPEVWIRKGDDRGITGFPYGVWCYEKSATLANFPEGALILAPTEEVPCAACNRGIRYELCKLYVEATPCAGSSGASGGSGGKRLFVRIDRLPATTKYFRHAPAPGSPDSLICWRIDPNDEAVCIPHTSDAWAVQQIGTLFDTCEACGDPALPGVEATVDRDPLSTCYPPPEALREYWARVEDIEAFRARYPDAGPILYVRIDGRCHALDMGAPDQRIPLGTHVRIVAPWCGFASCLDCLCGNALATDCVRELGIPVHLCGGANGDGWEETWLHESAIPGDHTVFVHDDRCVFVDPADGLSEIPLDARILYAITNTKESCESCSNDAPGNGDGGGGGGGGGDSDDPPPPIRDCYWKLVYCVGHPTKAGQRVPFVYVKAPCPRYRRTHVVAGKYADSDGTWCVALVDPRRVPPIGFDPAGISDQRWGFSGQGCSKYHPCDCRPCFHLYDCSAMLRPRSTDSDLSEHVGKSLWLGDRCWEIREGYGGGPINPVTVNPGDLYPGCGECNTIYWLQRCDGQASILTREDLSEHLGKVVEVGGECYTVGTTVLLPGDDLQPVTVGAVYDTCEACEDPPPSGECIGCDQV